MAQRGFGVGTPDASHEQGPLGEVGFDGSIVHTVSVISEARVGIVGSIEEEFAGHAEFVSAWRIVRRSGALEHTIRLEKLPTNVARQVCERIGQLAGVRRSRIEHLWLSAKSEIA